DSTRIKEVTDQAKEIKTLKAQIKKLKKQAKPVISHHGAWMKSISLKQRLVGVGTRLTLHNTIQSRN
ncbi:hypothetical protein Tco_0346796, partial [Tanacetum coccineum]